MNYCFSVKIAPLPVRWTVQRLTSWASGCPGNRLLCCRAGAGCIPDQTKQGAATQDSKTNGADPEIIGFRPSVLTMQAIRDLCHSKLMPNLKHPCLSSVTASNQSPPHYQLLKIHFHLLLHAPRAPGGLLVGGAGGPRGGRIREVGGGCGGGGG
jgi:hypothetical protein